MATFAGLIACATVCDVAGDVEGVSGCFFSAFGEFFGDALLGDLGDLGDFWISITAMLSFGISTSSGLSRANEFFVMTPSTFGLMSGLLPNVKLFEASGFDDSLNDGNFIELRKMFEFSTGVITMGFVASAKTLGRTSFKRALTGGGS